MSTRELMVDLMMYKLWANEQVFGVLQGQDSLAQAPVMAQLLHHVYVVDSIFQAHLQGAPRPYGTANPAEVPGLQGLRPLIHSLDKWYVDYARGATSTLLRQALEIELTTGQSLTLTRAQILMHVSHHGAGHRGNVATLMYGAGLPLPPDRLTSYFIHGQGGVKAGPA